MIQPIICAAIYRQALSTICVLFLSYAIYTEIAAITNASIGYANITVNGWCATTIIAELMVNIILIVAVGRCALTAQRVPRLTTAIYTELMVD
jgi:hypothetical protein